MLTVDTHTHIIAPDRGRYPLAAEGGQLVERVDGMPVSAEGLVGEMEAARVDRAVFVQYHGVYGYENAYVVDAAREHAKRAAAVCIIDMLASQAAETLTELVTTGGVRGVRMFQTAAEPDAPWLHDPRGLATWDCARERGIPVVMARTPGVAVPPEQGKQHVARLRNLLDRYTDVPVALDHLGVIGVPAEGPALPQELLDLAEFPNVHCKLTTVSLYRAERAGVPYAEFFGPLFERFGADRVMWGSNYPNTYDRPYPQMVEFARDALAYLDTSEQEWVFGRTALRLWPELA
jgi:L-fuconolactonase